jgi:hypothetical protein
MGFIVVLYITEKPGSPQEWNMIRREEVVGRRDEVGGGQAIVIKNGQ